MLKKTKKMKTTMRKLRRESLLKVTHYANFIATVRAKILMTTIMTDKP